MDPEVLGKIVDAVTALGEQGTMAFIAYLGFVYGTKLLINIIWATCFITVGRFFYGVITKAFERRDPTNSSKK